MPCQGTLTSDASFTTDGRILSAILDTYIDARNNDNGQLIYAYGRVYAYATGWFVIRGGSGNAELVDPSADVQSAGGIWRNAVGGDTFSTNFLPPIGNGFRPLTIPFTFDVPFFLSASDDIRFQSGYFTNTEFFFEDGAFLLATFHIQTLDGQPIPGAVIEQTTPEPNLGLAVILMLGILLRNGWKNRIIRC
jgi:hypothetical protein